MVRLAANLGVQVIDFVSNLSRHEAVGLIPQNKEFQMWLPYSDRLPHSASCGPALSLLSTGNHSQDRNPLKQVAGATDISAHSLLPRFARTLPAVLRRDSEIKRLILLLNRHQHGGRSLHMAILDSYGPIGARQTSHNGRFAAYWSLFLTIRRRQRV
jgi:hypothetical protein